MSVWCCRAFYLSEEVFKELVLGSSVASLGQEVFEGLVSVSFVYSALHIGFLPTHPPLSCQLFIPKVLLLLSDLL
jgi:hypothetical protein